MLLGRSVFALCLLTGAVQVMSGQVGGIGDPALMTGTPRQSQQLGSVDSVNYYNGQVNISIPVRNIGGSGRGAAVKSVVVGIDREWTVFDSYGSYVPSTAYQPSYGFTYALGSLSVEAGSGNPYGCPIYNENGNYYTDKALGPYSTTIAWQNGGNQTILYDVRLNGQQQGANITDCSQVDSYQQANRGRVFRSADGNDITFIADSDVYDGGSGGAHPAGVLILRDGTKYRFGFDSYLTSIEDRNGNIMTVNFSPTSAGALEHFTDSISRVFNIDFTECLGGCYAAPDTVDIYKFYGAGGSYRETRVNYALLSNSLAPGESIRSYQTLFPLLNGSSTSTFDPWVISSVIYPDGAGYTMQYNSYGEVVKLTTPTGGYYTYRYPEAYAGTGDGSIQMTDGSHKIVRHVQERDEYSDGVNLTAKTLFSYSEYPSNLDAQHPSRPASVVQVLFQNSSSQTLRNEVHYFYGTPGSNQPPPADGSKYAEWWLGLEFYSFVLDHSDNILRAQNTIYGQRPCEAGGNCWVDPQADSAPAHDTQVCQVNTTENNGATSSVVMLYDQHNNMTDKYEYDYGSAPAIGANCPGTPGGWKRRTAMTYRTDAQYLDPSVHIVNLPFETRVFNEANQQVSFEYLLYDEYQYRPLQEAPGILGHDGNYGTGFAARGNLTSIWRAEDGVTLTALTRNTVDIAGNLVQQIDPNNHTTSWEFNTDGANGYAFPTRTTNALGEQSTAAYDYSIGALAWAQDWTGTTTYTDHSASDPLDRTTAVRTYSNGNLLQQTGYEYPNRRNTYTRSDLNTPGDQLLRQDHIVDGLGRTFQDYYYENGSQFIYTYTGLDALGRVGVTWNPSRLGDNLNYSTSYEYDGLGRPASVTKQDGSVSSWSYVGNTMTATDEAGVKKTTFYDAFGRPSSVHEDPNVSNLTTDYEYDALGNLINVNQRGQLRGFAYDGLSRLTRANNPESGLTTYTYDKAGNVATKTDYRGVQLSYAYDSLNRLASKSSSDGTVNTHIYRNDYGRQQAITSPASTTYLAFDALGRTTGSTQVTAGHNYYFGYSYNAAGQLTSETYPSGRVVTTSYDQAGREFALQGNWSGALTNYVTQAYYTPSGNMYYFTRGNGVWHATGYNARLQPTESYEAVNNSLGSMYFVSCTNWGDGPNGSSPAYTRAGNVYKVCPDMAASVNNGSLRGYTEMNGGPGYPSFLQFNQSFTYDALNRLTGVNDSGGYVRNFQYDPWGNMSVNNNTGVPLSGLTPQTSNNPINTANNRLWAGTYDAAGNQTQVGSVAVGYDAENHQIRSQDGNDPGVSYSYDGEDHRVSKAIDGGPTTVYVYDAQSRLISEYTTATGTLNPPCWICYLSYDHLGNVRLITGHDAGIVARHDYLAFGEEVFAGYAGRDARFGAYDSVAQRFTGQQADAESSLNYFYARYFGGRLGRFTSPDPENAGADLMNPQSWNGYSYALNNPMLNTDPTGMDTCGPGSYNHCVDVTDKGPDSIQVFSFCYYCLSSGSLGDFDKMNVAPPPPMVYQPQPFAPQPAKNGNTRPAKFCLDPSCMMKTYLPAPRTSPVNWKKFTMYLSCLAGAPPELMAAASGSPQDVTDFTPETQGRTTAWGYTPGKQKNGGQAPLNPSSAPELGEAAANAPSYLNNALSCSAVVANMK